MIARSKLIQAIEWQLSALSDAELIDVHKHIGGLIERSHRFTIVPKDEAVNSVLVFCACGWAREAPHRSDAVAAHDEHLRSDG